MLHSIGGDLPPENNFMSHALQVARDLRDRLFSFDRVSKNVEEAVFAASVKGILLFHIHCRKVLVSYGDLATATAKMPKGGQLAQALERIAEDDHRNGRPLSTAIVVAKNTERPGEGFFTQCEQLGYRVGKTEQERLSFWREQASKFGIRLSLRTDEHDADATVLKELEQASGLSIEKDGEVRVLASLWPSAPTLEEAYLKQFAPSPVPFRPPVTVERPNGRTSLSHDPWKEELKNAKVIAPMGPDEQREKVMEMSPHINVPPHKLQERDIIILDNGQEVMVTHVDVQTVLGRHSVTAKRTVWRDNVGNQYTSDDGMYHLRVKRSAKAEPASMLPGDEPKKATPPATSPKAASRSRDRKGSRLQKHQPQ